MTTDLATTQDILSLEVVARLSDKLQQLPAMWVHVLAQVLSRPTPEQFIRRHEGPHRGIITYVDGSYAVDTLSALTSLGISADFDVLETCVYDDAIECLAKLTFSYYCNGSWHSTSRSQWGDCEIRPGMSRGSARKGASTDALKKCLSTFGWAHDVYSTPLEFQLPPSKEDLYQQSLDSLFTIGKNRGMIETEVTSWVQEQTGQLPNELSVKDLAAVKRRLQRVERVPDIVGTDES